VAAHAETRGPKRDKKGRIPFLRYEGCQQLSQILMFFFCFKFHIKLHSALFKQTLPSETFAAQ